MKKYYLAIAAIILVILVGYAVSGNQPGTATKPKPQGNATVPVAAGTPYHEIANPSGFVNSDPFALKDLIGKKVILVDFLTYSCINCIRTFPYLNDWYAKYKDAGLEIVGIHTPEFAFEKKYDNVVAAMRQYHIEFPIVLDNDYGTWHAYGNEYWPRKYIIDIHGNIVYDHIGEGNYDETEAKIKELLADRAAFFGSSSTVEHMPLTTVGNTGDLTQVNSPETYFGAARNEYLGNGSPHLAGDQLLPIPAKVRPNTLYLTGNCHFQDEYAQNTGTHDSIRYTFHAKQLNFVASADSMVSVQVLVDGKPADNLAGSDVVNGVLKVKDERLYEVVNDPNGYNDHTIELRVNSPGLKAFTFTFG